MGLLRSNAAASPATSVMNAVAHLSGNQESRAAEAVTTSKSGDVGQADLDGGEGAALAGDDDQCVVVVAVGGDGLGDATLSD